MKKQFVDIMDSLDFEQGEELFKYLYDELLKKYEKRLGVYFYGLKHQYKLFKLFCLGNIRCLKKAVLDLNNTMDYILSAYEKDNDYFKEIIKKAIKNRDDALEFFWEYIEDGKKYEKLSKEKYNFRDRAMLLLKLFPQLIENLVKRESILLNEVNIIIGVSERSKKSNNLNSVINNLFNTPTYDLKDYVDKNLLGISINQFRNIVSHSSFELRNEKIYATYSNGKQKELSIIEAEQILFEIYKLRIFVKLCLNLGIDFILSKYPELRKELRIIPETAIIDINSNVRGYGINFKSYEISDKLIIDGHDVSQKNDVYFILEIESNKLSIAKAIKIIFLYIVNLFPVFKKENNFPDLSKILWVLKVHFKNINKALFISIGYDEIKILKSHPIAYVEMIANKLKDIKQMNI